MSDAAERWLRENDPSYAQSRRNWRHLDGEDCDTPRQEVVWGDDLDLERLVAALAQPNAYVEAPEDLLCERCDKTFVPVTRWQRYCSSPCRQAAYRDRVTQSS